jgi:hypothetical protein
MDIAKVLFFGIGVTWFTLFLRIVLIAHRAARYIKKTHPSEWENDIMLRLGVSALGGSDVFSLAAKINDPKIESYRKRWMAAIRDLLISALVAVGLSVLYIYFHPATGVVK